MQQNKAKFHGRFATIKRRIEGLDEIQEGKFRHFLASAALATVRKEEFIGRPFTIRELADAYHVASRFPVSGDLSHAATTEEEKHIKELKREAYFLAEVLKVRREFFSPFKPFVEPRSIPKRIKDLLEELEQLKSAMVESLEAQGV